MRWIIAAHVATGQSVEFDLWRLIVWNLDLFFCASKVMETMSAEARCGSVWGISWDCLKNRMFLRVSSFVVVDSAGLVVLLYSHERMAKKNAPTISWEHAEARLSLLLENSWTILLMTEMGMAFCFFSFGSWAL
jgi:hypothetical protein